MITWWSLSIICCLFMTAYIYMNQIFKIPSYILMIYRGLILFLILLPFTYFIPVSFSWEFYAFASFQGLLIGFNDNRFLESSRRYGAEITGSLKPFSLVITFVLWPLIIPSNYSYILDDPLHFSIITLCIIGTVIAARSINKVQANKEAVRFIIPCILCSGFIDIFNKTTMSFRGDNLIVYASFYYLLITALFSGLYNLVIYVKHKHKFRELFKKNHIIAGLIILMIIPWVTGVKAYAMALTPNPAYVSAIMFTSPIWIIAANCIYFKINKECKYIKVNKKALALLLISVITLVLVTR